MCLPLRPSGYEYWSHLCARLSIGQVYNLSVSGITASIQKCLNPIFALINDLAVGYNLMKQR